MRKNIFLSMFFVFAVTLFSACSQLIVPYTLSPKIGQGDITLEGIVKDNKIAPIILVGDSGDKPVIFLENSRNHIVMNNTTFERKVASLVEVGDWIRFYKNFRTNTVEIEVSKRRGKCELKIFFNYTDDNKYNLEKLYYESDNPYKTDCPRMNVEKEKLTLEQLSK